MVKLSLATVLIFSSILYTGASFAQDAGLAEQGNCGKPIDCYERAVSLLNSARAELKAESTDLRAKIANLETRAAGLEEANRQLESWKKWAGDAINSMWAWSHGNEIWIAGNCFRPRRLVRCHMEGYGHLSWWENENECIAAKGLVDSTSIVLAQCN